MTPAYLQQIGLVGAVKVSDQATINQQMKLALDKIAFLPFGKLIDEWRWKVFAGEVKPENYNAAWWAAARAVPGHRRAGRAHRGGFRSGREISHSRQYAVHALLPVVHPAVPVPQGAVRGGRVSRDRCMNARCTATRRPASDFRRNAGAGASQPWQDTLEKLTGTRADGRLGDHRVLRAVDGLAGRTEQGPKPAAGKSHDNCFTTTSAATDAARDHSFHHPRDDPRRSKYLSRFVCRPHDRVGYPGGSGLDGCAPRAGRRAHSRKQYRADRRFGRFIDCSRRDLHGAGVGDPGLLGRFQIFVGARDRRPRRRARRVVLGAAAPLADRRSATRVSRRQGCGRSAQSR